MSSKHAWARRRGRRPALCLWPARGLGCGRPWLRGRDDEGGWGGHVVIEGGGRKKEGRGADQPERRKGPGIVSSFFWRCVRCLFACREERAVLRGCVRAACFVRRRGVRGGARAGRRGGRESARGGRSACAPPAVTSPSQGGPRQGGGRGGAANQETGGGIRKAVPLQLGCGGVGVRCC